MKLTELIASKEYRYHHTSWSRGYVSRKNKNPEAVPYDGKFGTGYKVYCPAYHTTKYCHVMYFVKEAAQ